MLVIADTSPLNYLVWIEVVELLPQLYVRVVIPPEVRDELLAPTHLRRCGPGPEPFRVG